MEGNAWLFSGYLAKRILSKRVSLKIQVTLGGSWTADTKSRPAGCPKTIFRPVQRYVIDLSTRQVFCGRAEHLAHQRLSIAQVIVIFLTLTQMSSLMQMLWKIPCKVLMEC